MAIKIIFLIALIALTSGLFFGFFGGGSGLIYVPAFYWLIY